MNRRVRVLGMGIFLIFVSAGICAADVDDALKSKIMASIESNLKEKTVQSGTLDLYDEDIEKVRNLRLIQKEEEVTEQEGAYFCKSEYRDINSGDIVLIEFQVAQDGEDLSVEEIRIKDVRKLDQGAAQEDKQYTDEDIQAYMRDYIQKQTQFTGGKLMMFDEDHQKMRHLELKELSPEVRRMGIFCSSGSKFVDADSGDILVIDISVENKKGKLSMQALRIRDVQKGP